jgi:hypothetical protein
MELRFIGPDLRSLDGSGVELLACSVWRDQRPMHGVAGLLDFRLAGALIRKEYLAGELGEVLFVPGRPRLRFDKVLVFGLGARSGFGEGTFRNVLSHVVRALAGLRVRRAVVELPGRAEGLIEPERARELLLESLGDSEQNDIWWLVEPADAQRRMAERAQDERRRSRRE